MKTTELLKEEKKIKVYTPNPYFVDLTIREYSKEDIEKMLYDLEQAVYFLRNVLKVLGISNKKAIEKEYTLNARTGEELWRIAIDKKCISSEFKGLIQKHNW